MTTIPPTAPAIAFLGTGRMDAFSSTTSAESMGDCTAAARPGLVHDSTSPVDAVVRARAYGTTASTAFTGGRGPDGLEQRRRPAACPTAGEEASHDK